MSNTGSSSATYHNGLTDAQAIRELKALGIDWPSK